MIMILLIALVGRVILLASGSVSFHSDEAIVALMARHITQGERPTFFYGQAYMGSLDAWLIAIGFRLLGESVLTIRIVQSGLYLLFVVTSYLAAWTLSRRLVVALVAGLIVAVPSVLVALYTTATLGGYNETLIFGNLLIILGYSAARETRPVWWRWGLIGLIAGLGWWTNALIIIYAIPLGLYIIYHLARSGLTFTKFYPVLMALLGFLIGSAPWWLYALEHEWAPLRFLLPAGLRGSGVGADIAEVSFPLRLVGLFLFGLPSALGMRFPWLGEFFAPVVAVLIFVLYLVALVSSATRPSQSSLLSGARCILFGMIGLMCLMFLLTRFSSDPSGRYFMPLVLPLGVILGGLIDHLLQGEKRAYRLAGVGIITLVMGYQALGQISAARGSVGLTTQFSLETHIPNTDDAALIQWLDEQNVHTGYTNYWIAFRLAFLSQEQFQFSATLPDRSNLEYTPAFERIPAYRATADSSHQVAYVTANVPEIEQGLEDWFKRENITYQVAQVGTYRIYYDFTPVIPRPPLPFIINVSGRESAR